FFLKNFKSVYEITVLIGELLHYYHPLYLFIPPEDQVPPHLESLFSCGHLGGDCFCTVGYTLYGHGGVGLQSRLRHRNLPVQPSFVRSVVFYLYTLFVYIYLLLLGQVLQPLLEPESGERLSPLSGSKRGCRTCPSRS